MYFWKALISTRLGYVKQPVDVYKRQVVTLLKHPYTRQLTGQAELLEKELTRNNRFLSLIHIYPSATGKWRMRLTIIWYGVLPGKLRLAILTL